MQLLLPPALTALDARLEAEARSGQAAAHAAHRTLDAMARTEVGRVSGALGLSGLLKQYRAAGAEALTPPADSRSGGAFLYQEIPLRIAGDADALAPRFRLGARYDFYRVETLPGDEKFGAPRALDFHAASGSIGVSVPVRDAVTVAMSAARAFRAPTMEELYSNAFHAANGTFDRGNPELRQETSQGLDAIVRAVSADQRAACGLLQPRERLHHAEHRNEHDHRRRGWKHHGAAQRVLSEDATLRGVEGRVEGDVIHRLFPWTSGDVVRGPSQALRAESVEELRARVQGDLLAASR